MKTKTSVIIIALLGLFCLKANAQILKIADIFFVAGYVFEENTKEPIPYVNIYVKQTRRGTITDNKGYFMLKAEINDTLIFSCLGFDKKYVHINQEVIDNNEALIISLDTKIYEIQSVDIYALRKYKQLEYEIKSMKLKDDDIVHAQSNFPLRPVDVDYYDLVQSAPLSGFGVVISPITALYEACSKKGKENRKLAELKKQDNIQNLIEQKLGVENIMKIINEDEATTLDFIEWCDFHEDFLLNISAYDLATVIKYKYKVYKVHPSLRAR